MATGGRTYVVLSMVAYPHRGRKAGYRVELDGRLSNHHRIRTVLKVQDYLLPVDLSLSRR